MPTLSSAGIGSGLDVNGLVAQLVAAEGQPVAQRLARQQSGIRLELSAFGQLRSALDGIATSASSLLGVDALNARQVSAQDEDVLSASASSGAATGRFSVEIQQLAQSQRLASSVPQNPADADIGYGTLDITLGSDSFSLNIDSSAQTLDDIRNAINDASDNPGVQATILNTDAGAVLQLSSNRSGSDSQIQLSASGGDGGLNSLIGNLAEAQPAQDAIIMVNGYQVTSSSNSVSGVLDGVTLELKQARPGEQFDVTISKDAQPLTEAVDRFVSAYNSYVEQARAMGGYNAATGEAGSLNGDSLLRSASNQLRLALNQGYGDDASLLSQLGIEIAVDGKLSVDEAALSAAASADFQAVVSFFDGEDGFATRMQNIASSFTSDSGMIDGRVDSLNSQLERIERQSDALDLRLERIEARYLKQFAALDAMLAQMQQTSSYLSQQLANLPGSTQQER